jgi:hypothetical protein
MIDSSKLRTVRVLFAAALAVAGCSVTSGGEIPCIQDASCPNDYPVCGPAGKCIAGTATGNVSVAIVGTAGKQAGDPVRGTISIQVAARSSSGIKSLSLAGGGKTFTPAAGATGPVYAFTVDTTTLADGPVTFKATATPGDPSVQPVDSTAFALTVDNTAPVLTSSATIAPVALGSLVTLDVTATETLATLTANVLLLGSVIGQGTELSAPTGNVHHLGFAVVSTATPATYTFSITATDLAGNPTAAALTKPFTVVANPTSNVTVDLANVTNGDPVKVTTGFTGGTAVISAVPPPVAPDTLPAAPTPGLQITLHPAADTVYTLSVTNAAGVTASSTVKVFVAQSVSVSLTGPTAPISPGDPINLQATVGSNATQAVINPGNVSVSAGATNQSIPVSPSATTTYTLIATNGAGRDYSTTKTITVSQPQILSFTGPAVVTGNAGGIVLTAQFSPYSTTPGAPTATAAVAVPGAPGTFCTAGSVTGTGTGTQTFGCPAIAADTTYTLDLTLGTAVIHANLAVQAAPAPSIEAFVATPPVLPFSPLPSPLGPGTIGLISQYCATPNPNPPTFRCSATVSANGGSPVNQPHSGTPPTAAQIPQSSATTTYTLLVTNTAGATGSAQVTVPNYKGTVATNAMGSAHIGGIAALLPSGKVLVAGGSTDNTATNAVDYAELFDPSTGSWSAVQCGCGALCGGTGTPKVTLQAKRFQAAATSLSNGRVLITGGANSGSSALATVDVYDPTEDCFRANATGLQTARAAHTATAYGANQAVIIGGNGLSTCEVYTAGLGINDGTFAACSGTAPKKDMQVNRANHVAILLSSRYVLVAGGGPAGDRSADIYDTASNGSNGFTALSATVMQVARTSATATLLSNGKVLIAGGGSATAELFTFTAGPPPGGSTAATSNSMGVSRTGHAAIALNGGGVLMAGGNASTAVDAYDPVANAFGTTFSLATARPNATIGFGLLLDGRSVVAGGTTTATAAEYIIP